MQSRSVTLSQIVKWMREAHQCPSRTIVVFIKTILLSHPRVVRGLSKPPASQPVATVSTPGPASDYQAVSLRRSAAYFEVYCMDDIWNRK
eukprot:COSAG05_NODE_186_length_14726_cov_28.333630_4_plen_90_part_00